MTDDRASFAGAAVHQPKTAELVAEQIRKRIALRELPAGSMLPPESVLMGQFGISRPTLREAIRILESEALIVLRRGARGGAQVLGPDPAVASRHLGMLLQSRQTTLKDVYHARTVLEPACAALLAARSTKAIVAQLEQALAEESEQADDLERLTLAGRAFTRRLSSSPPVPPLGRSAPRSLISWNFMGTPSARSSGAIRHDGNATFGLCTWPTSGCWRPSGPALPARQNSSGGSTWKPSPKSCWTESE